MDEYRLSALCCDIPIYDGHTRSYSQQQIQRQKQQRMFKELNPLLHSELRLAVMSVLLSVESADFVYLREQTGATAGNLSVQLDKLQKAGYITIEKGFKGKMPRTTCAITQDGVAAFEEYVAALRSYIGKGI
jgi:DNA-binding MarR family transcriptional regulator